MFRRDFLVAGVVGLLGVFGLKSKISLPNDWVLTNEWEHSGNKYKMYKKTHVLNLVDNQPNPLPTAFEVRNYDTFEKEYWYNEVEVGEGKIYVNDQFYGMSPITIGKTPNTKVSFSFPENHSVWQHDMHWLKNKLKTLGMCN